jgi:hypothetical protein
MAVPSLKKPEPALGRVGAATSISTGTGTAPVRLSKGYRAIYRIAADGTVEFVSVEEVNKHAY